MKNTIFESSDRTVFIRGKVINSKVIDLPEEWDEIVDARTITVMLTAVGAHQNVIVKRFDSKQVHLQSNGAIPIECYYHVFAELKGT
jgi:hypothetical protein